MMRPTFMSIHICKWLFPPSRAYYVIDLGGVDFSRTISELGVYLVLLESTIKSQRCPGRVPWIHLAGTGCSRPMWGRPALVERGAAAGTLRCMAPHWNDTNHRLFFTSATKEMEQVTLATTSPESIILFS